MGQIKNIKLHIVTDIKVSKITSMASRQVAARAVNWAALAARVPKDPKASAGFDEMRIKFETAKGTLNSTAEKPVPIDWDHYKAVVKDQALVEKLHAAYSGLVVPYPDTAGLLSNLEAEKAEQLSIDAATKADLEVAVAQAQSNIDKIENKKSYEIMTQEEFFELNPDKAAEAEAAAAKTAQVLYGPVVGVEYLPGWDPVNERVIPAAEIEAKHKEMLEAEVVDEKLTIVDKTAILVKAIVGSVVGLVKK